MAILNVFALIVAGLMVGNELAIPQFDVRLKVSTSANRRTHQIIGVSEASPRVWPCPGLVQSQPCR